MKRKIANIREISVRCLLVLSLVLAGGNLPALAQDICAVCSQPIGAEGFFITDSLTGQRDLVCSNCAFTLPRCYLCGLPIKHGEETKLPDGRFLCARDASTAVLDARQAQQICAEVKDDLDHVFSRFTSFPDNVNVSVIDRIDVDEMFDRSGHDFESPDLLGCIRPVTDDGPKHYEMKLMIGLPRSELKETCAHEYTHAWVGENVSPHRHAGIARDTEEGFCEMMGYLLMDAQGEEGEKQRILKNLYTRGQVQLFIAAEQQYGLEDILDWMRFGVGSHLEPGRLDEIKDVKMPSLALKTAVIPATAIPTSRPTAAASGPTVIKLEGILWGNQPSAIINGRSFFASDVNEVRLGGTNVAIRCQSIEPARVRVQNLASGQTLNLVLP